MSTELWIAYCGYLVWLTSGLGDFLCHKRTDLPHTSGVAESRTHLLQLALLGIAIVLGLAFAMGRSLALVLLVLVVAHASVGYWDTRIAFRTQRVILPVEQHLHSVLDSAPIIAFGWLLARTWPDALRGDWTLALRMPAVPPVAWATVLVPPVLLCIVPALLEYAAARRA